jgi:hypothetical protein
MIATVLSSVDAAYLTTLGNTKFAGFMLSILLDDLADEQSDSHILLEECEKMIFLNKPLNLKKVPLSERPQAEFIGHMWGMIQINMRQFPRFEPLKEIIRYDFERIVDTLRYARLSNKFCNAINEEEAFIHEGNNINVSIDAMMDVMCSPSFDLSELGKLREHVWHAQMMCKIANWIATWRREVLIGDWTSGIIAMGLRAGIITHDNLLKGNRSMIVKQIENSALEENLMLEWQNHRVWIRERARDVRSVDLNKYLKGIEQFYRMQMFSVGLQ